MLSRIRNLQPKKKLKIYSILLCILSALLFLLTMASLSIMGSNLMVTDELSTSSDLDAFEQQHSSNYQPYTAYIVSQRMIVAFDVLCVLGIPLLMFSVFKFYTKGNLIIIIINSILQAVRWISALIFVAGESQLR